MEATRNKPKCKEDCQEHVFELKNNNGNTKLETHINFCPKFRRDPHRPEKTIPEYNLDHKYYTNAFVIGTEMKTLRNNAQQEQMHFQTMIKDACQKNNQVMFPRPNQKNSFCSVCREHYRNYFEHINTQQHRIKIEAAIYNTEIKRLTDVFKSKWEGAHAKANQIINEIVRQNQLYKKMKINEEEGQEQQEDEEAEDGNEDENNEGSENDEQNNENEQQANQDADDKSGEVEQEQQERKQNMISQPKNDMEVQKNQASEVNDQEDSQKQQQWQYSANLQSQQKITPDNTTKQSFNFQFFEKRTELCVFLRKNKNGKYQIVKDIQKYLNTKNPGSSQQKQIRPGTAKVPTSDRSLRNRQERKKSTEHKKNRQTFKIKNPRREQSSQYRGNSSSFQSNEGENLCQTLKDKILSDRIRTRNQCKQQKIEKPIMELKSDLPCERKSQANKQKAKHTQQAPRNNSMPPPYAFYNPQMNPYANLQKNQMQGAGNLKQMPANSKMPPMPPFPMYMPPNHPNSQMMKAPPTNGNRMNPSGYMPHPSMMMNPPPYFGYGMPPPMRPQNSTNNLKPTNPNVNGATTTNTNNADKSKQRPQQFPMYYPNTWNPYMMNSHQMMRQEGGNEQSQQQQQGNVPPRQPMVYPHHHPYMMPPQSSGTNPTGKQPNQPPNPNLGVNMPPHNPNMYMQYPMDPRYYMAYPPNGYMGKKPEEGPPSGPPGPPGPPRDPR